MGVWPLLCWLRFFSPQETKFRHLTGLMCRGGSRTQDISEVAAVLVISRACQLVMCARMSVRHKKDFFRL